MITYKKYRRQLTAGKFFNTLNSCDKYNTVFSKVIAPLPSTTAVNVGVSVSVVTVACHISIHKTSKDSFLISNCRFDRFVPKHKHQIYLQAWHASLGPKKVESDVVETLSPEYVACAKSDASCTDIMFANNDHQST